MRTKIMSLMPSRSCTRYISPTRLGQASRSASVSPVPQRRWRSAEPPRRATTHRPLWKGQGPPPGVLSYREILGISRRGSKTFSSHKNGPNQPSDLSTVSVGKNAKYLDAQSVVKVLTSLNIDIPGLVGGFLKPKPALQKMKSQDDSCLKSETTSTSKMESEKKTDETKDSRNQYWSADVEDIKREQHDFADAMSNAHESVKTYLLDMMPKDTSGSTRRPNSRPTATATDTQKNTETSAPSSLVDQLKQYIPSAPFAAKSPTKEEEVKKRLEILRKLSEAKSSTDRRTRGLVMSLKRASTDESKISRLQDFCNHLIQNPSAKAVAVKELAIPALLKMMTRTQDQTMKEYAHQALTMVGYTFPVKDRGIKILSIDGGGTRGLMAIQLLGEIEKLTGKPVRETFDYICGVSTGALLATMISVRNVPLKDCEAMYKQFSKDMFSRSRWVGASKLVTAHAYYDHVIWEKILQETIGGTSFIDSAKDLNCPKTSLVSTLMNRQIVENYLFRNYTYLEGTSSHYPGSYHHKLWEGIRASSAAPTYYQEFKLGDFIHQDGGVLANNPTAVAIHEARLLWPDVPVQCVISLGTGRYRPTGDPEPTVSLRNKIDKMVQSATDTEAVHTMLQDLLPPLTYFRFNPYMSENFTLDEIREDKWHQMKTVTDMYIRKNELKLQSAARVLGLQKQPQHKIRDWAKVTLDERIRV